MLLHLKPNANSARWDRHRERDVHDTVDVCDADPDAPWSGVWCSTDIDTFWLKDDLDWNRDVYDKLRSGESVTVELTVASPDDSPSRKE